MDVWARIMLPLRLAPIKGIGAPSLIFTSDLQIKYLAL